MPYNFAADSYHTKKHCSRLSSSEVRFFKEIGRFAFLRFPLGDLGATYDDRFRLIGKRVVDFLLVLIELFLLVVTAETLRAIIGSKSANLLQRGRVDPKYQVVGVAPTNHSSYRKTWLNNLSYDIKIWTDLSSILSQITRLTRTDRRTDRRTEFSSLDRVCIVCSAVIIDRMRKCLPPGRHSGYILRPRKHQLCLIKKSRLDEKNFM